MALTQRQKAILNEALTRYESDGGLFVDLLEMTKAQQKQALLPYLQAIRSERNSTASTVEAQAQTVKTTAQQDITEIDNLNL